MTLHCDFLRTLERVSQIDKPVMSTQLMGLTGQFLQRRWILEDGYLSAIPIEVLDGEDEADVEVDVDAGTYSFYRLGGQTAKVTRALGEITVYFFNIDAWLDEITALFDIEPSKVARRRELIQGHLWHLGDLRAGRTSKFVPLYVSRRQQKCNSEWEDALLDLKRASHGVVLMDQFHFGTSMPNSHKGLEIDSLLADVGSEVKLDREVLERILSGIRNSATNIDDFNEITGDLNLLCMDKKHRFKGVQKSVVSMFWHARNLPSLKWEDVMSQTGCGKDPGSVFRNPDWDELLIRVAAGCYRLRIKGATK